LRKSGRCLWGVRWKMPADRTIDPSNCGRELC